MTINIMEEKMSKIYIFGAGKNGIELLKLINKLEIAEVEAFIDNNCKKLGTKIEGKECISIEEAIRNGAQKEQVIVSPKNYQSIETQLKEYNFKHIFCWSKFLPHPQYCIPIINDASDFKNVVPFNHYESPYPDITKIHKKEGKLFEKNKEILDIDFNISGQLKLIEKMTKLNLPKWDGRYSYNNSWFVKGSADALYYMIRIIKPKTIIEIGSGYSTAIMLDVNEKYFRNQINIISIEPRPDRLKSLLKPKDNVYILEKDLQDIPPSFFEELEENDMLFIDSSHVSKMDSDVNYEFFEIFPRLKQGVYIHFHDVYYPFIYPKTLIYDGRAYNEMYLLRAFLMNNKEYSIQLFGEMLEEKYSKEIPSSLKGVGSGSLWIKKSSK